MSEHGDRLPGDAPHGLGGAELDRRAPLQFRLNGRTIHGFAGDTEVFDRHATKVPARLRVSRPGGAWTATSSAARQGASRRHEAVRRRACRGPSIGTTRERRAGHARPRGGAALGGRAAQGTRPNGPGAGGSAHRPAHPQPCSSGHSKRARNIVKGNSSGTRGQRSRTRPIHPRRFPAPAAAKRCPSLRAPRSRRGSRGSGPISHRRRTTRRHAARY